METHYNYKLGIPLVLSSALLSSTGQLFWKLSLGEINLFLIIGFVLYGLGAIVMTVAFRFGEVSILHPMLGTSIVLSIVYGKIFLHETITSGKIMGIIFIAIGLVILASTNRNAKVII